MSQENRSAEAGESRVSKALKPEDHKDNHVRRGGVAPRSLQPAGDWICPAQVLEPSEEPDADMKDLHEQDDSQRSGRGDKEGRVGEETACLSHVSSSSSGWEAS